MFRLKTVRLQAQGRVKDRSRDARPFSLDSNWRRACFLPLSARNERGGLGRGVAGLLVCNTRTRLTLPLSPALSPFVPHGAREKKKALPSAMHS
jgi:hypothetical protein